MTLVGRLLIADLNARKERMANSATHIDLGCYVGLIEYALAFRALVVGSELDETRCREAASDWRGLVQCAVGIDILVELLVVAVLRVVLDLHAIIEFVLDRSRREMRPEGHVA